MPVPQPPFEAVISLGGFCQVAYQIEQRFGFRISSPFDWLVTPLGSVARVLADAGVRLGTDVTVSFNGQTAVCAHYGVAYHHEFPRNAEQQVVIGEAALRTCRGKLLHKYKCFSDLMATHPRTLFIRMGGHHESAFPFPYVADPRPVGTDDLNALSATLAEAFPGLPFAIAAVFVKGVTPLQIDRTDLDARISVFELPWGHAPTWDGEVSDWAPVFDRFAFDLRGCSGQARQFVGAEHQECLHG